MRLFRRGPALALDVDRTALRPGEDVRARVALGEPDERTTAARVELQYVNRYTYALSADPGASSTGLRTSTITVAAAPLPAGPGTAEVVLRLPEDAPPSAEDSVSWRARAVIERRGGRDVQEDVDLDVRSAPEGYGDRVSRPLEQADGFHAEIEVDRRTLRPGDVVRGTTTVVASEDLEGPGLYVRVHGLRLGEGGTRRGYNSRTIALAEPARLLAGVPQHHAFELQVPDDARPTFVAEHSSLEWYVEVGIPRRLVEDRLARLPLVVRR